MTQEERETINRRIFEWLHPDGCWHDEQLDVLSSCNKCGQVPNFHLHATINPDYSSRECFWLLLEGLEAKGCHFTMRTSDDDRYYVLLTRDVTEPFNDTDVARTTAETLPLALVSATLKLIESNTAPALSVDSPNDRNKQD